ncbi:MAG: sigma-70 family RNA polymerase sigma factor [Myxococcaceae bacterium]|nr:sigma-70 family RNA polymerase sigma factor [Myxococcaceae bacterium]
MLAAHTSQPLDLPAELAGPGALVERCRAGDEAAWRSLYDEHFEFAWRTARRLGLPEADVEDAVQESFQVAWQQLPTFTWGRFTTWLYRIVANVVSARLRRRRVRDVFAGLFGRAEPGEDTIDGRLEARHTLRSVERILRRLSREKREAFALFEIEGLTHEQIAELTGARVETVRTRLFYARREFQALARELGVEP